MISPAGATLLAAAVALGLAAALPLRTRLPSAAVTALLAASGILAAAGLLTTQPGAKAPDWVVGCAGLAAIVPFHFRMLFGPFGRRAEAREGAG